MTIEISRHRPADVKSAKESTTRDSDFLYASYLDGREVRWQASFDKAVANAGDDARARVLAIFDALRECGEDEALRGCTFTGVSPLSAGPLTRMIIERHDRTLRNRLAELAEEAAVADVSALVDQLLVLIRTATILHETGTRPAAIGEAGATAARLVDTHR